jgi:LDH2 family malate/lactate/ureidoglycolate dehydrogenase
MPAADRLIPHHELKKFAARLLEAAGLAAAKSELAAGTLVAANLRGVD